VKSADMLMVVLRRRQQHTEKALILPSSRSGVQTLFAFFQGSGFSKYKKIQLIWNIILRAKKTGGGGNGLFG